MKRAYLFGPLAVLLAFTLFTLTANATEVSDKFTRGALNTTTGWTELPLQIFQQSSEHPYLGTTYGFMEGLSRGLQRTLYGAWDSVTFLIPPYDKPVMEPATVFEKS